MWTDAKSKAEQSMSGFGDDAFYAESRLTFKKGDTYVTVEVQTNKDDPKTPEGSQHILELEKQVAQRALERFGS